MSRETNDYMYRSLSDFIWKSFLAGLCIGIAALCFLKGGQIVGAALFSFGLAAIILSKWRLFTGACGFADYRNPFSSVNVLLMLAVNALGVGVAAVTGSSPEAVETAAKIAEGRFAMPPLKIFGCAVLCGFIMTLSVMHARKGNWIPLLLGIPTFIICGFPHCVADVAYYSLSGRWGMPWLLTIAGNFVGCNLPTLTLKERSPLLLRDGIPPATSQADSEISIQSEK